MQDVERRLAFGIKGRIGARWEPSAVAPFLPHLVGCQPKPADYPVHQTLVVLAIEGLTQRHRLVAQAGSAAKTEVELVDQHGHVAKGTERLIVVLVLPHEVSTTIIPVFEQDVGRLLEPKAGGPVLHHVGIIRRQSMPPHILWGQHAITDSSKTAVGQHTGAVDLAIGLLDAGPVEVAIIEGVAGSGHDKLCHFLPLRGERVPHGLKLAELLERVRDYIFFPARHSAEIEGVVSSYATCADFAGHVLPHCPKLPPAPSSCMLAILLTAPPS